MEKLFKKTGLYLSLMLIFISVLGVVSCKKENFTQTTNTDLNITGYLQAHPEEFSEFYKILKLTGNTSYLNAWGTYTVFAPTNDAINTYLQNIGKSSIEDVDIESLKDLAKLHILQDTISTTDFTDGKIKIPSVLGQYITTGVVNESGVSRITINKNSKVVRSNIRLGNGIVHSIDMPLIKVVRTLAQEIAATPSLSIFNEALIATGWDVTLNKPLTFIDSIGSYVSVLAETNEFYNESNISSVADLIDKYSNTGNPKDPLDSLNLYIAYRVLPGLKYVADFITAPSHVTSAPLEIISVKLSKDTVLLNEEVFNNIKEKGIPIDRGNSDVGATNGVLHLIKGNLFIKTRYPTPVYWDIAKFPEIEGLTGIYGTPGKWQAISKGFIKDVTWGGAATTTITYSCNSGNHNHAGAYNSDYLSITLRTAVIPWIEFKTPVIIRGRYKVWVSYRTTRRNNTTANTGIFYLDGVPLPRTAWFGEWYNKDIPATELEAQGYKRHNAVAPNNNWNTRLLGTIDVQTTDRHVLRIETNTNEGVDSTIDMIHFIPVEMDQLWPRFGPNGELVYN
jgi:uncharacterized surface protein with fasciclin (FAS1) repeats